MLDRNLPYSEVHGMPGIRYVQDGKTYNAGGHEVSPDSGVIINHERPQPSPRDDTVIRLAYVAESENDIGKTIETMHWKQLKNIVENYGGEWKNREQAIQFLRGDRSNESLRE